MEEQEDTRANSLTFTPVDSVDSIVADIRAAGYHAEAVGGGFQTDMPDDEYRAFMAARGYVRDEE